VIIKLNQSEQAVINMLDFITEGHLCFLSFVSVFKDIYINEQLKTRKFSKHFHFFTNLDHEVMPSNLPVNHCR
jgi:hypothetical protein